MNDQTSVEACRFARLTIRMRYPIWLEAEERPWTCLRGDEPQPIEDTSICHGCSRWMPHRVHADELPAS